MNPRIGAVRHHFSTVDSTNVFARKLVARGAPHGTLVTAEMQTAGRGRFDRQWRSDAGSNLLVSIILTPRRAFEDWGCLPLLTGLATMQAVEAVAQVGAWLKWPNDVFVGDRKLSGILIESGGHDATHWAVAGIGINVNQTEFTGEFAHRPTSLRIEKGRAFSRAVLLDELAAALTTWLDVWEAAGNAPIVTAWRRACPLMGRHVLAGDGGERRRVLVEDVAPDGSLIVVDESGARKELYAGDISLALGKDSEP